MRSETQLKHFISACVFVTCGRDGLEGPELKPDMFDASRVPVCAEDNESKLFPDETSAGPRCAEK